MQTGCLPPVSSTVLPPFFWALLLATCLCRSFNSFNCNSSIIYHYHFIPSFLTSYSCLSCLFSESYFCASSLQIFWCSSLILAFMSFGRMSDDSGMLARIPRRKFYELSSFLGFHKKAILYLFGLFLLLLGHSHLLFGLHNVSEFVIRVAAFLLLNNEIAINSLIVLVLYELKNRMRTVLHSFNLIYNTIFLDALN